MVHPWHVTPFQYNVPHPNARRSGKDESTLSQTLRCVIHWLGYKANRKTHLGIVEFAINSLPNRSTGYNPFYLNYGYHPVMPTEFIKGDELMKNESISNLVQRLSNV